MSESPESAVRTLAQIAKKLAAGSFAPLSEAFAQTATDSTVDRQGAVSLLQALSQTLGLDLAQAEELLPQLEGGKDGYSLEDLRETLKQFCEKEQPAAETSRSSSSGKRENSSSDSESKKSPSRKSSRRSKSSASPAVPQEDRKEATDRSPVAQSTGRGLKPAEEDLQRLTGEIDQALKAIKGEKDDSAPVSVNSSMVSDDPLVKKLRDSVADFEVMKAEREAAGEDVSALQSVLKTLKSQLAKVEHASSQDEKGRQRQQFRERCARSLHELFQFYSNQLRLLGKTPSFDLIQHNSQTWNISKFMRFCQDFGLLADKHRKDSERTLDLSTVKSVFTRNSLLQKEMNEDQFAQAVERLAELYFDAEYDASHKTEVAGKTAEEKRDMFFRHLQLDRPNECLKQAKGFGIPFHSKTDNRVPENDLAQKYKYRPRRQLLPTQTEEQRQSSDPPKPGKVSSPPKLAPADAIVSYSSKPQLAENAALQKYGVKARNPFTWKTLGELNPEELMGRGEELDLSTLIAEDSSDDEILKKQYPLAASQPVLPPNLPKAKFPSPRKPAKDPAAKPPLKPIALVQKTKDLSASLIRKEKQQLERTLKAEEAQRERGNKVLKRLRQSSQY